MNYVEMAVGIQHCLEGVGSAKDGRDAKEWALAAAVLIDKEMTYTAYLNDRKPPTEAPPSKD